jgi:hypothetical protein
VRAAPGIHPEGVALRVGRLLCCHHKGGYILLREISSTSSSALLLSLLPSKGIAVLLDMPTFLAI